MADVDKELEGQGEAVVHQTRRDEDALGGAEVYIAVATGAVAKLGGEVGRDKNVFWRIGAGGDIAPHLGDGKGDEVVRLALQRVSHGGGNGIDDLFQIGA